MNIIHWHYIKNTNIYQSFIKIKWLVDFEKILCFYRLIIYFVAI